MLAGIAGTVLAISIMLAVSGAPPNAAGPTDSPALAPPDGLVLTADPVTGLAPLLVDFNLTLPSGPPPSISWSFGDGTWLNGTAPADLAPVHVFENIGAFDVTVTATWSYGALNASTTITAAGSNLSVVATAAPENGTAPLSVWLNGTPAGGSGTYVDESWSFGDGGIGTGLAVRYTYATAGEYRATLTVEDSRGSRANATVAVTVSPPHNATKPPKTGNDGNTSSAPGLPGWTVPVVVAILALSAVIAGLVYGLERRDRHRLRSLTIPRAPSALRPSWDGPRPPPDAGAGSAVLLSKAAGSSPSVVSREGAHPNSPPQPSSIATALGPLPGAQQLTLRLLQRLATLPRVAPGEIPTRECTQAGLADYLGAGQSAVSKILRRLSASGIVESATGHVTGNTRRVRIYRLTARGERLGRSLPDPSAPAGSEEKGTRGSRGRP